jgi:hypothetical protein
LGPDKSIEVMLCEGPFDAIAFDYALGSKYRKEYYIVATPGPFQEKWAPLFAGRKLCSFFDADKGGDQRREEVRKHLVESGVVADYRYVRWPEEMRGLDVNDFVRQYANVAIRGFVRQHSVHVAPKPKLIIYHGRRSEDKVRKIEWIWPNHLRCGTYVSFGGFQGTFKSTLAFEIASRYTTGSPLPTWKDGKLSWEEVEMPAGHVLYIYAEDGRDEAEDAFERAGGDFDYWHGMPAQTGEGEDLNVLEHLAEMEQIIREFGIRLVIIDGQNSVVGAPCIATDMLARSNITNKLHYFAQKLNICLIGIRNEDADGRALGPQSFADIGRCVMRAVEEDRGSDPPYCKLEFVKVSDTARKNYRPIPYSIADHGGNRREVIWGKCKPSLKEGLAKGAANRAAAAKIAAEKAQAQKTAEKGQKPHAK